MDTDVLSRTLPTTVAPDDAVLLLLVMVRVAIPIIDGTVGRPMI